jgi:hypothetical protein
MPQVLAACTLQRDGDLFLHHIPDDVRRGFMGGYRFGQQVIRRKGIHRYSQVWFNTPSNLRLRLLRLKGRNVYKNLVLNQTV